MSDGQVLLLAAVAFVAALVPVAWPPWPFALVVVGALLVQRPALFIVAVALLVSGLSARSWVGLEAGPPHRVSGEATVVTDPEHVGRGTVAVLRVDGRRYQAWGFGGAGFRLGQTLAGHRVAVQGTARAYPGPDERRAALHIGHQLSAEDITWESSGSLPWRLANAFRETVAAGAVSLGQERRSLFTGVVYGDDRHQSPEVEDDFRAVGLTHLLAVSGQNVAFVLMVARPLLERLRLRGRWVGTITILVLFAFVTRFEPSVLRATGMAGIAATSGLLGRPSSTLRVLALAVAALLVVDPLLAETVAFRLSVAASLGIVVGAARLEERLRGPRWFRGVASVTVAAQVAVAPVLVGTFGSLSLMSVPANLLAAPVAGPLMMWGLTGGVAAGLLGGSAAAVLHQPTSAMLWWLESVAGWSAAVPVGRLGATGGAAALVLAVAVVLAARPRSSRRVGRSSREEPKPPRVTGGV